MEELEVLLGYVAKTLNIANIEVAALIKTDDGKVKEDALSTLLDKDKDRVKTLKTEAHDLGHKKANKEVMKTFENSLKEKFELESDKQGLELIETLLEVKAPKTDGKAKFTDDDVKKHPLYIQAENKVKEVKDLTEKEWKAKFEEKEKEYTRGTVLSVVEKKALDLISELNPVLSSDPKRAANQKKDLIEKIIKNGFEIQDNEIILIGEEGKRLEDDHGNRIKFDDFVKDTVTSYYDLPVANPRSSAANGGEKKDQQPAGKKYTGPIPKTESEFLDILYRKENPLSIEEKAELTDAFNAQKAT